MLIGVNKNDVLSFEVHIDKDNNTVTCNKKIGIEQRIKGIVDEFNAMSWDEKCEKYELENFNEENGEENVKTNSKIKTIILDEIKANEYSESDYIYETSETQDIRIFKGKAIDIADNLKFFSNKSLPDDVLDLVQNFTNKMEEYSLREEDIINSRDYLEEKLIYMGKNSKYRGCIGKVVKNREDEASELVQFQNKFRDSGNIARFWSKPENLVALKNEKTRG